MSAKMMNENAKVTTSTTYFTYDHLTKKIVGTELNFRKSGNPGSEQDIELMARIAEHPNYDFHVIKPAKQKNSYKGLTRALMYDYLDIQKDELSKDLMAQLEQMKKDGVGYPAIKSWFLDAFPQFNVTKAEKAVREARLGGVKKKYKTIKVAPKSNSKPSSNIADLPAASGQ